MPLPPTKLAEATSALLQSVKRNFGPHTEQFSFPLFFFCKSPPHKIAQPDLNAFYRGFKGKLLWGLFLTVHEKLNCITAIMKIIAFFVYFKFYATYSKRCE